MLANGGKNEAKLYSLDMADADMIIDNTESVKRVSSIGIFDAQDIIHQTRFDLNAMPKLYDIVLNSVNATIALFGGNPNDYSDTANCTNELIQVIRAWRAVGIELKQLPRGETFPPCITCRTGCENDIYINGDLETGMNCDNDPNTTLANYNFADIPLDLELVQHQISPVMQSCEGSTIGGSITFTPQFGRENCSVDILIDDINQGDITNIGTITNLNEGTHTIALVDGFDSNNNLSFSIRIPKKEIWQGASPLVYTTNESAAGANDGSITAHVGSTEILEFLWDFPGGSSVDLITHNSTIENLSAGTYSVTIKFAGTDCIYGTFTTTVGTNGSGNPICTFNQDLMFMRAVPAIFNDQTIIEVELQEKPLQLNLVAFDMQGNPVQNLLNGQVLQTGTHQIPFNGSSDPNGIYIFSLNISVPQCRSGTQESISIKGLKY